MVNRKSFLQPFCQTFLAEIWQKFGRKTFCDYLVFWSFCRKSVLWRQKGLFLVGKVSVVNKIMPFWPKSCKNYYNFEAKFCTNQVGVAGFCCRKRPFLPKRVFWSTTNSNSSSGKKLFFFIFPEARTIAS